jgi:ubiquinone/menaquinone biosynthesis C-methylase UbiE
MTKPRIVETEQGIQGEFNVNVYDEMQRRLRDKGWIETKAILTSGINSGFALEVGPGPGYLGLEWLKNTQGTLLKGLDISADMIAVAERNAAEYGLSDRVEYIQGSGSEIPFDDSAFDAVFTNGSLHEWSELKKTLDEIHRVLKLKGKYFISDLRRDMFFLVKWFLWINTRPKQIRPGLITSINAAYTPNEIREIIAETSLTNSLVKGNPIGLMITGTKNV